MKFRLPYPDKPERLPGDDFECVGPSLAKQAEAEACDINLIMARYVKTGVIEHVRDNPGTFQDLPTSMEFQDALEMSKAAQGAFDLLPAEMRAQFGNDPVKFLQFADANEDYMEKLGIVPRKETLAAESAEVVRADPNVLPGQTGLPGIAADVPPKK